MAERIDVMISSTARDLPEHRNDVLEACQRQGMFATRMEDLPAMDENAATASLKMVDEAEVYIGVFAHRYGYIPAENNSERISITEMEYNRAVEQKKPRLIFIIDKEHPIKIDDVEKGEGEAKLAAFLERVGKENIVRFFKSPVELRAEAINSLAQYKQKKSEEEAKSHLDEPHDPSTFHYVSDIPTPPERYVAHTYSLLQTSDLVGRQDELNKLTDWVVNSDSEHVFAVVAIGGMGKSALTWKWFNEIAPEEMKPLAGRMWWSFYESDASFENFVIRALAYASKRSIEEIRQLPSPDRDTELLAALDREPFLLVLDGLERILLAYARGDAARLKDTQVGDQRKVRKTTDPRVGNFLRKLAQVENSRILISTRLYPADLETEGGDPLPNISWLNLPGLTEDDAMRLWRAFGVKGSRDQLQPVFDSIDRHPLLIQALAGEIKRYKKAPGNFEEWRKNNPAFDPASFPRVQDAMGHVMEYALHDLKEKPRKVLNMIAAFRMPTSYDTLTALVIGGENPCGNEMELDAILIELEDRGLVGWDKRANRYDLHPIVRGVVWSGLADETRQGVYTSIHAHFEAVPMIENYREVNSLEDLTPAVELYNTLIGMGRYDAAGRLFYERLDKATLYRLSASRQRVEMLEMLFPDGLDEMPRRNKQDGQAFTLNALALAYQYSGQPGRAAPLYRRQILIRSEMDAEESVAIGLENLSNTLRVTGGLQESESAVRRALEIARRRKDNFGEAVSLYWLGLTFSTHGEAEGSRAALRRSLKIFLTQFSESDAIVAMPFMAQRDLWFGEFPEALTFADRAWKLAGLVKNELNFIRASRLQGEVALGLDDFAKADERLHHALTRARAVNMVEEELPALIALAELRRREGDEKEAREFLDDVWEYAERGPYPLLHANALNVLAQIERDAGDKVAAIEAATKAYELSWCDGPPYAYHWGLIKAQKHLEELGAPLPKMEPFDESKFEPMPKVEIDPDDEFHVGDKESS